MAEDYINKDLARDYFQIDSYQCSEIIGKLEIKRAIEKCEIDLISFYQANHSLPKDKRFIKRASRILELILEHGPKEASRIIQEERIQELRTRTLFDDAPRPPDTKPSNFFS